MKTWPLLISAVATVALVTASAARAQASFHYDLRFDDETKVKTVAPNTTYSLNLWGEITGDTNLANDSWTFGYIGIDPTKVGAGAMYNPGNSTQVGITGATLGAHVNGGMAGAQNTSASFDDNIKGWGGGPSSTTDWTLWLSAANGGTGFNGGQFDAQSVQLSINSQEVLVATFTLQTGASVNTAGSVGDMTTFNAVGKPYWGVGVAKHYGICYYNDSTTPPSPGTQIKDWSTVSFGSPVELLARTQPALLPGDANGDGTVDIADLSALLSNYDKTGMGWSQGDFDGNGAVDIQDLSNVLTNYDKTASASAGVRAVPEPTALVLAALGSVGLRLGARRRRE
jgi:hypothetical protein